MKKFLALLIVGTLSICYFAGCSNNDSNNKSTINTTNSVSESTSDKTSGTGNETEGKSETLADSSEYAPVTIENNGITVTYETPPERVVALSYDTAEILIALGLEDKIVAVAPNMNTLDETMDEYRDILTGIPTFPESELTNGVPSFETVLTVEPDFVYGSFYSFKSGNCGAADDYIANKINMYATISTYASEGSIDYLYQTISEIGMIFGVSERANKLIDELKNRVEVVEEKVSGLEPVKVFVFDYDMKNGTLNTTGGINYEDALIKAAGGKTIFDNLGTKYSVVSQEEIIVQEPLYVVINSYYTAEDGKNKISYMNTTPELSKVPAVVNKNYLTFSGLEISAGLQSINTLEKMAQTFHPEAFE